MKSILRINQTEIVVENVTPISDEFALKASSQIFKSPEQYDVLMIPQEIFGKEEQSETIVDGILHGKIEGEFPVSVKFFHKSLEGKEQFTSLFLEIPAFIGFRN
ncbi:Hypothetical protein KNT65_gp231 [Escherichia phage EcS1]|uniref:Uncharacterized protein n=1 Tax=Escherichia phage EcS1 TaxID=2083276 RepID=A0A2Z5ZCW3_9CAUD|nr:Hypothetical protein KNT65_gp231 [Escherichia phage EcS1]BBC78262.1 Hypothetical protein [Escherichia phage EcS1]